MNIISLLIRYIGTYKNQNERHNIFITQKGG